MTTSCLLLKKKIKKEKRFNARFLAVGPEVAVIKEIHMARIPSISTSRGEKVRKLFEERRNKWISVISSEDLTSQTTFSVKAASVVNILSLEKWLNCGIVTIQIEFRPKI